jgi:gliding motility-associated-like protein
MHKLLSLLTSGLLILLVCADLKAQCTSATCSVPVPAVNAQDACILPSPQALNCYYGGTTATIPVSFPPTWCSDINNNHWFAFTATSSLAFFTVTLTGCTSGNGIQVAVFSTTDCINFTPVSTCTPILPPTAYTLIAPGLVPGQVYYLCVDGIAGSICDYTINGADPTIFIAGNPNICLPNDFSKKYATATVSTWSINPPSAGTIVGNPVSNSITVEWAEPGPAQVCAQNVTCPNAPLECIDIYVGGGYVEEHVNLCEGSTVTCAGQSFSNPGLFYVGLNNGTGCDSTVLCVIHLVPINTDTITETRSVCQGDSVQCAGQYFSTAGVYPVSLLSYTGCDSTVKCQINILPVVTSPVKVVNICGPAAYQLCDTTVTTSGLYTRTCTSSLGCDSIVQIDLAILQPNVTIPPPAALTCDPDSLVTLHLTGTILNLSNGGTTHFQWSGPGIVGPDTLTTLVVNQPGQYCLVLTHGRDTLFCSDTVCITVIQSSSVLPAPLIFGNPTPCINTTDIYTVTAVGGSLPNSYSWTVPGNLTFLQLAPDSIAIYWPDTAVYGQICVTAIDSCGPSLPACVTIVLQPATTSKTVAICQGQTLLVGGGLQSTAGVYIDTLQTVTGCDSILTTTLVVQSIDTVTYFLNTCIAANSGTIIEVLTQANGCDSLIITYVNYHPADTLQVTSNSCDPNNAGVFTQSFINQYGCDSTIITTVQYLPQDSTLFFSTTCDPTAVGVFVQMLINIAGCDSLLISTITLSQVDTTYLSATTCDPANVGIFTQMLGNQQGCDSLIITTVTLSPGSTTILTGTTCDQANVGVFTQMLGNQQGCDSLIITTVTLSPGSTTILTGTTCNPANVGVFTQTQPNQFGCDSTIISTITLVLPDTTYLGGTTCEPPSAGVFVQHLPTAQGCDSIVVTTVTLLPVSETILESTTCDPATAGVFVFHLFNQFGCDSMVTQIVVLQPESAITLAQTTCDPALVGTEVEILSNQYGCDSTVTTITTLSPPATCLVSISLEGWTIPCDALYGALDLTALQGKVPFSYVVLLGSSQVGNGTLTTLNTPKLIISLPPGDYTVVVTDANGATATATATIQSSIPPILVASLAADFNGFGVSCAGEFDGSANANATGGHPPYSFAWSNNSQGANVSGLIAGTYTVTVTDANFCTSSASINVASPPPLSFTFMVNGLSCFGAQNGAIQVIAQGGVAPYTYSLGNNGFQSSNLFSNLSSGAYTVTTMDANNCQRTEIILINAGIPYNVDLGDDQTIDQGGSTVLQAIVNFPIDSILSVVWTPPYNGQDCPQCLELVVAPFVSTTYSVLITAFDGCAGSDEVTVIVDLEKHLYVPNVFSPNDDGLNELFRLFAEPETIERFKTFQIFDRWGEKVFSYDNFLPDDNIGWDGRFKGKPLGPGVFVWYVEVVYLDKTTQIFKGDVTLVR